MTNRPRNALADYMHVAQVGPPYDEEQFMPMPDGAIGPGNIYGLYVGGHAGKRGLPPMTEASPVTRFLNNRLMGRFDAQTAPSPAGGGSDMDMMQIYGPEDQVAFDNLGRPIPLVDPRHPRNQMPSSSPYPQQRR